MTTGEITTLLSAVATFVTALAGLVSAWRQPRK